MVNNLYPKLLDLYNNKKYFLSRKDFCGIIGVDITNWKTYNKIITILSDEGILEEIRDPDSRLINIKINRSKFDRYIRSLKIFGKFVDFVSVSTKGAFYIGYPG